MEQEVVKRKRGRPRKDALIPRQNHTDPMEPAQRKFVAAWIETGQIKRAAELANVTERTGQRWAKRGDILVRLEEAFVKYGIDDHTLADRLFAALHAQRVIQIPQGDGTTALSYHDDHPTQLRAVATTTDILMRLRAMERGAEGNQDLPDLPADLSAMGTQEIIEYAVKRTIRRNL